MSPVPTKVTGRRTGAFIIDWLLWSVLSAALFAALAEHNVPVTSSNHTTVRINNEDWVLQGGTYWLWLGLVLAILLGLAVVMEGRTGYTPGKYLLGVGVVNPEGEPPGMGRAAVRLIGWVVDAAPWFLLWGLCAFITSLTSKGNRRVGDMMAGTYVVHRDAMGQPVVLPTGMVPAVAPAPAGPLVAPGVAAASSTGSGRDAFGNPVASSHREAEPAPSSATTASTPSSSGLPSADWYADPTGAKRLRYWDGSAWTNHVAD